MICILALIAAGHHQIILRLLWFVCKLSYPPVCSARYHLKAPIEMRNVFVRDSRAPPASWAATCVASGQLWAINRVRIKFKIFKDHHKFEEVVWSIAHCNTVQKYLQRGMRAICWLLPSSAALVVLDLRKVMRIPLPWHDDVAEYLIVYINSKYQHYSARGRPDH